VTCRILLGRRDGAGRGLGSAELSRGGSSRRATLPIRRAAIRSDSTLRPDHLHTLGDALRIHPALPGVAPPTDRPSDSNWIHEIKHDGYRMMARRDPVGIRLITRNGHDWTERYPLVVEAMNHLKVRSCLIDGEVVCCDEKGVAAFQLRRHRRNEAQAFLYAFDLLELNGADLRREPIEVRKATLASILRKSRDGVRLNEHLEHPEGDVVFRHACKGR
jgi:bifunctional non-homologous end joining protein LigD